jgi:glycopeptide antibiotics resistance protein
MVVKNQFSVEKVLPLLLATYICLALLFTLHPRPILLSTDPSEIELFLMTHTGLFYKVLYADANLVTIGNYLLLTLPALIVKIRYPNIKSKFILTFFFALTLFIELLQRLIPGRVSDLRDLFSNTVSALLGLAFAHLILYYSGQISAKNGAR